MDYIDELLSDFQYNDNDILEHYGMPRRSGRYPWGSGEDPYQHNKDFLGRVQEMKKSGMSEREVAEALEIFNDKGEPSTSRLRAQVTIANSERRMYEINMIKSMREDGLGWTEIGRKLGKSESTVRSMMDEKSISKAAEVRNIADKIKEVVDKKGMIDVGVGVERELGVSPERLNAALDVLQEEGYPVYKGGIPNTTNPGKQLNQRVICPPGTKHKEIYNFENVHTMDEYTSHDNGKTFDKFVYPTSLDSKRLKIRYADEVGPDGFRGIDKDGTIEIRPGVADLSLGDARYSQVRIMVDNKYYLKGMAYYNKDLPEGVDVVFNCNKAEGSPMDVALKKIKADPDNPFGSLIKANGQSYYTDENGERKLSLINKRADEGDWSEWKDALPSQFLGKQSKHMAQQQLDLAKADKLAEFDSICELNNPTIKKHYLQDFAQKCDAAAVNLQAAALPGQKYHVIIPVNTLKDTEVYAPRYENGTKLALIRYPHGGTFEIPILTVNNRNPQAKEIIGNSLDAVGINKHNADRLSGADFDGDTVMCIPTHDRKGKVKVTSTKELDGLKGFDPKDKYSYDEIKVDANGTEHLYKNGREFKRMKNTGTEMGKISNLITDMTLAGANEDELSRAVRHSMVVIDAEKHKLDYRQSEVDNNIAALVNKYQRKVDADGNVKVGGAATILSRAKGEYSVPKRQGTARVNLKGKEWYDPTRPEGALIYKTADNLEYQKTRVNKRTGKVTTVTRIRTQPSTNMAETDDAYSLVSEDRWPMELLYADYANSMKALANQARVEINNTGKIAYSKQAKAKYAEEVASLEQKLDDALRNAPKERAAQRLANVRVSEKQAADPDMKKSDLKKVKQQAITAARSDVGATSRRDRNIVITDTEWEAIQAGAVHEITLKKILKNSDADVLRQKAMPKQTSTLSQAKINKIKAMNMSNYSLEEIAAANGVSVSTVTKYLKGEK